MGWKSKKDGTHFNSDKKKRDVGGHYEITETDVKSNFEPMYEEQEKFAEDRKNDFELDQVIKDKFKDKSDNELRNYIQNTSGNDDDQMYELKRRGRSWHYEGDKMIFDDADWIDGHLVTKADQKSYDDMMRKKGAIDIKELETIGNVLGKRRLSVVADNPIDHLKDVNGRFLGKRSRLFHSKSVNEEMLPLDDYEKVVGVWDD